MSWTMRWRSCFFIPFGKLEGITDEAFAQLYIAPDSMMDD